MLGLGMMTGPFFGGVLYEIGGFYLPFVTCGSCLVICGIISYFLLESNHYETHTNGMSNKEPNKQVKFMELLKMPSILICCFLLINAQMSITWYMVGIIQRAQSCTPLMADLLQDIN